MFIELRFKISRTFSVLLMLALFSMPVMALNLDRAKAQGLVSEAPSGYLVAVMPSSDVNTLVMKINAGRKAEYQKIANKRGISLRAVEQLAGQRLTK